MEKFSNNPIHVSLAHSYLGKLDGTDEFTCVPLCYRAFLLSLRSMCLRVSGLKSHLKLKAVLDYYYPQLVGSIHFYSFVVREMESKLHAGLSLFDEFSIDWKNLSKSDFGSFDYDMLFALLSALSSFFSSMNVSTRVFRDVINAL